MPRMTNAQLVDENIRLREHCARLEAKLAEANRAYEDAHGALMHVSTERDVAVDGLHRLKTELLASRINAAIATQPATPHRVVVIKGQRYAKVPAFEGGRTVITYKPL